MEPCQHFQDLLLDSLYGLLEAGEEEALRAHVASCPDCGTAMSEAREQHELLARAARVIQEVPAFVSPAKQPLVHAVSGPAEPVILPLPVIERRRPWKRWLAVSAAAALLLAAGTGWTLYERGLEDRR